jgi:hypothetical protein
MGTRILLHPLLVPGTPIDLALLSDVASSIDDLSVDEQTRSSANALLIQFSERPDVFLHVDSVVNSDCPSIAKFAVLLSLERVAQDCWLGSHQGNVAVASGHRAASRSFH